MGPKVVCIDSKRENANDIQASLSQMLSNGELDAEQMSLIEERYPDFRR